MVISFKSLVKIHLPIETWQVWLPSGTFAPRIESQHDFYLSLPKLNRSFAKIDQVNPHPFVPAPTLVGGEIPKKRRMVKIRIMPGILL